MDHGSIDRSLVPHIGAKGKIRTKPQGFAVKTGKMYATTATDVKTALVENHCV